MKAAKTRDARPRGQGRPRKDEADVARQSLVAAAREMLKTRAPAQIDRQDIARAAGVDPALIRYYFGNKDRLLLETAQQMLFAMRSEREAAHQAQGAFRSKLATYTSYLVATLHRYPFLHDLLLEQIARAGKGDADDLRRNFIELPWQEVCAMLDGAVANREIRPVDPAFFYVALIGMCSFPMRHQVLLARVQGTEGVTPSTAASYGAFVADMLATGLALDQRQRARTAVAKTTAVAKVA